MASVDVAVPCYQYGGYLRECGTSVLKQSVSDLRVLILDNGSTDDTFEIARQISSEDSRVQVMRFDTNRGSHAAYNAGIDWASADYFLILDADDTLAPACLERAVSVMERHRSVSFTHGIEIQMRQGENTPPPKISEGEARVLISTSAEFIESLCRTPVNSIGAQTVVRRTAAQKQVGHYRPELPYTDDLEMWLRLGSVGCVALIEAVQAIRRVHGQQESARYRKDHQVRDFREREAAFESFFAREGQSIPGSDGLRRQAKRGLGDHAYWSAISHACRGYLGTSIELFRFSRQRRDATILPPVGWLLRMDHPMRRVADIAAEMVRWKHKA